MRPPRRLSKRRRWQTLVTRHRRAEPRSVCQRLVVPQRENIRRVAGWWQVRGTTRLARPARSTQARHAFSSVWNQVASMKTLRICIHTSLWSRAIEHCPSTPRERSRPGTKRRSTRLRRSARSAIGRTGRRRTRRPRSSARSSRGKAGSAVTVPSTAKPPADRDRRPSKRTRKGAGPRGSGAFLVVTGCLSQPCASSSRSAISDVRASISAFSRSISSRARKSSSVMDRDARIAAR